MLDLWPNDATCWCDRAKFWISNWVCMPWKFWFWLLILGMFLRFQKWLSVFCEQQRSFFEVFSWLGSLLNHRPLITVLFNFLGSLGKRRVKFYGRNLQRNNSFFLYFLPGSYTVENRVAKSLEIVSPKSWILTFSSLNTPIKKTPKHETSCYLPVFRNLPSKWKLLRKSWSFFVTTWSILAANISGSVRILFNIYILIWKVFHSALQKWSWIFCQFFSFWIIRQNVGEKCKIFLKFLWTRKKNITSLSLSRVL